jgi:hypothetical protein
VLAALLAGLQLAMVGALLAHQPWAATVVVACFAVAAWTWPEQAALILVAFVPLGTLLGILGPRMAWSETMLAGAVLGWLLHRVQNPPGPVVAWPAIALALACLGLASALALTWAEIEATIPPAMTLAQWVRLLSDGFERHASPMRQAVRLAWGVAAAVMLSEVARDRAARQRIAGLLLMSVAALASLSVYRAIEVSLRSEAPIERLLEVMRAVRIAPIIGDPNATGALFLLVTPMALQLAVASRTRLWGWTATGLLLGAAWLAGSRTTLAMTPVAMVATLLLCSRWADRARVWSVAAAMSGLAVLLLLLAPTPRNVEASTAWTIRKELAVVTGRMLMDEPLFGVGIGQYYARSRDFITEPLKQYYARENAHNQFFQIAGELGLFGLVAFAGMLLVALLPAVRARPPDAAGLLVGVVAFLVVSLGQHPLLDPAVGATFWLTLGLLVSATPQTANAWQRRLARGGLALALTALVLLPMQAARRLAAIDRSGAIVGASRERDDDGSQYFRATRTATLYLPSRATHCTLTFRVGRRPGEARIALRLNHRPAGQVTAIGGEWRDVTLTLPLTADTHPHRRLDVSWVAARPYRATIELRPPVCR